MRKVLLLLAALAGCSKGPAADLPAISEARSLAAEWALINEQASRGRLTPAYTKTMHKQLRDQLEAAASSLKLPNSRYGGEIGTLLALPDDAPPQDLRARAAELKRIEDSLESD